jgi:hypothetical protein
MLVSAISWAKYAPGASAGPSSGGVEAGSIMLIALMLWSKVVGLEQGWD